MMNLTTQVIGLDDSVKASIVDNFFRTWGANGFGAMTKRDTELLLFSCLKGALGHGGPRDNYEWAKLLRLTPTKVKSMRLEAELKNYLSDEVLPSVKLLVYLSDIKKLNLIKGNDGSLENVEVLLVCEDPVMRFELDHVAKSVSGYIDYRLNDELVVIELITFIEILKKLILNDEDSQKLMKGLVLKKIDGDKEVKKINNLLDGVAYAKKPEGQKLISFLEVLGDSFFPKQKALIDHLKTIFRSQAHSH